ncbi:hypothetical protein R1flu_005627 [Riccia fluitans]|uniref:Uncharacterized protein n=1 Tax=Riccia fluitans TaxID=41844 RepID=A0ABD1YUD8_9MARC
MAGMHGRAATVDFGRPMRNGTHTRQPSDIDSLSPEVVAALQSTFGGKLNALRSQASLERERQEAKPSPLQPTPEETAEPVSEVVDSENEAAFLVIAYVTGIVASILILVAAGAAAKPEGDVSCKGFGDSNCVRLYGYVLPIGVTGISLILALVLSVFDVSFGVYNVLKTMENFFETENYKLSDVLQVALSYLIDLGFIALAISLLWFARASSVDPLFTFCEEGAKVFWTFGLIAMGTVIFWCAVSSIKNPDSTYLFMTRAAKIVTLLLLLFGGSSVMYRIIAPPQRSRPCQAQPEAAEVNRTDKTQLQLYYKGWLYEIPDPESKRMQLYSEAHQFDRCLSGSGPCAPAVATCKPRPERHVCQTKDNDLEVCPARYDRGTCEARFDDQGICEARYEQPKCEAIYQQPKCEAKYEEGMCEARYDQPKCKPRSEQGMCPPKWRNEICKAIEWEECQWPWLKRIQVYERKDKCRYNLPVCDWPMVKRIQLYENREVCKYDCPSCDWPVVKRIQVYSRGNRCGYLELPECDWPFLKQIQQYEWKGRCSAKDLSHCDWPFMKQLQSYEDSMVRCGKCHSRFGKAGEHRHESFSPASV